MKRIVYSLAIAAALLMTSCSEDGPDNPGGGDTDTETAGKTLDDGTVPSFSQQVVQWNGEKADDASKDKVGNDADFYHEANTFDKTVTITFNGSSAATIDNKYAAVRTLVLGGYVIIDLQTLAAKGVELVLKGSTEDGGIKIYGAAKYKLTLDGVKIKSKKGPAINSQCKKRVFVHLADGTTNVIEDPETYTKDILYLNGGTFETEDAKGCFFSEGNVVFSGSGTLEIKGHAKHGLAMDAYMYMRPGVTIAVTSAPRNCFQIKGDYEEGIGLHMAGGYLYAMSESAAGKAIKTDENVVIEGGKLVLNTTGDAVVDDDQADTSSSSCIKADGYVDISNATMELRSTGLAGKAINSGSYLKITNGKVQASCSGAEFENTKLKLSASSKAIKAIEKITITGGTHTVLSTGASSGSKGIESDKQISINKATLNVYSYDDAISAPIVSVNDESDVSAYSVDDDGIRGKQTVYVFGGKVLAVGGSTPSAGIKTEELVIDGGQTIAIGGSSSATPREGGLSFGAWDGINAAKGATVKVGSVSFKMPRTFTEGKLLIASKAITGSESVE